MNDLKDLFERALGEGHGPGPAYACDPAADLARGQQLRQRRRRAGVAGLAAGTAVVAVGAWAGVSLTSPAAPPQAAGGGTAASAHTAKPAQAAKPAPKAAHPIALAAYQGKQPAGYRVAEMPVGWVVQGGDPFVLTIASANDPDQQFASYTGKLVVMLRSSSISGPARGGVSQPVDGRAGRYDVQGDTEILTYLDARGHWVVIQAPKSLGWGSARLAKFAGGVQVLGNAQPGKG